MTSRCGTCHGHGEVIISACGDVRAPKLGEAANEVCETCGGSGAAPGDRDELGAEDFEGQEA